MHSRLAHRSHTLSIQLAGLIWGLVHRASRGTQEQQHRCITLSLPNHLAASFHTFPFTLTVS